MKIYPNSIGGRAGRQKNECPKGRVFLSFASGLAKSGLGLYFLPAQGTGLAMCKAALAKEAMGKGKQAIAVLLRISLRIGIGYGQNFTFIHNRVCEQTDLMGFFYPDGYGMPGCPMIHRSEQIDQPADRVENSANCSATWTVRRGGRNPHSSGIFTFFSFMIMSERIERVILLPRHDRTSSFSRRVSFSFPAPPALISPRTAWAFNYNDVIGVICIFI